MLITWNEQVTSVVFADVIMAILKIQHKLDQDQMNLSCASNMIEMLDIIIDRI